jgi:hypothetical protein
MQIHDGQREVFGECAVVAEDSQDAPTFAVRRDSPPAIAARLAEAEPRTRQIDFADNAAANPSAILGACDALDFAHKFVAERALKIVVAAQNFDVGIADSREADANEGPARFQARQGFLDDNDAIPARDGGKHDKTIGAQGEATGNGL